MLSDRTSIAGRTIIVTGAAGAIGRVVAHSLAEVGVTVVLVDRDAAGLDAAAAPLRADGLAHQVAVGDACDLAAMQAIVAAVPGGAPDGVVALIGGVEPAEFGPYLGYGTATYDSIVDRNLRSAAVTLEAVAGGMVAAGRSGSLVAISAATALASAPFHGLYAAAKAAVISLVRTLAVEFGPLGIRVNSIAPGAVETRPAPDAAAMARMAQAAIPLGRRVLPEEIAAAALFLLSDLSSAVTGHTLVLDGGALAKPAFLDADNVPVFVTDPALRDRMRAGATHRISTT